jgi:dihydrofolate reductase
MRKIVAGMYMSLDGVVESPEKWTPAYFDNEVGQAVGSLIAAGDTLLLGRVTYQTFEAAFAADTGGNPVAAQMNEFAKVVVSTTLKSADWNNSTLIGDNVAEQITELKQKPGANINLSGSGSLVTWLLRNGLLDRLDLLVFPVVLGGGKRLFEGEGAPAALDLVHTETFGSGVLHHTYQVPAS